MKGMWTPRWCFTQSMLLAASIREARDYIHTKQRPHVAYIGWLGHENLGDEALFQGIQTHCTGWNLRHFAGARKERLLSAIYGSSNLYDFGLLGGGTLILGGYWRELALLSQRGVPCSVFGAGVEDPDFLESKGHKVELAVWKELLEEMGRIRVRGPRSRRTLEALGLRDVEVCGDPALLHFSYEHVGNGEDKILGVNYYAPKSHLGCDEPTLRDLFLRVCRRMRDKGWKIELFVVSVEDLPGGKALAKELSLGHDAVHFIPSNTAAYIDKVRRCRLFLGVRLHSVVLAHCAGVSSVLLGYLDKCHDYMESVGQGSYSVEAKEWDVDSIFSRLDELDRNYPERRQVLLAECERMRKCLIDSSRLMFI